MSRPNRVWPQRSVSVLVMVVSAKRTSAAPMPTSRTSRPDPTLGVIDGGIQASLRKAGPIACRGSRRDEPRDIVADGDERAAGFRLETIAVSGEPVSGRDAGRRQPYVLGPPRRQRAKPVRRPVDD